MRNLLIAVALSLAGVLPAASPAVVAQDMPQVALNDVRAPTADTLPKRPNFSPRVAQFCGQCTQDSHCGVGHKCCPMKGCPPSRPNGCFAVTTCP